MAKQLLLNALVDKLGGFIEGLSADNLEVGVWSGLVELHNLQLKPGCLKDFNLPVAVAHGSLKLLKLTVPWASLGSKPVKVEIDGLNLVAIPVDVSQLSAEELRKRVLGDKQAKLQAAEDAILKKGESNTSDAKAKASYTEQLTTKIMDNLEISITNIHFRFEDSYNIPNQHFSFGLTLDLVSLTTTNDQWKEAFVTRDKNLPSKVHKLGRIENMCVYWNQEESRMLHKMSADACDRAMKAMIYVSSEVNRSTKEQAEKATGALNYLFAPRNSSVLKVINAEKCDASVPKTDVMLESEDLVMTCDRSQFVQMMESSSLMSKLQKQSENAMRRPLERPTKDPRGWWKYAYSLVSGKELASGNLLVMASRCNKSKARYIDLVRRAYYRKQEGLTDSQKSSKSSKDESKTNPDVAMCEAEDRERTSLEETLPLTALLVFRQIAASQVKAGLIKKQEAEAKATPAKTSKKGMMGWLFGRKSNKDDGAEKTRRFSLSRKRSMNKEEEDEQLMEDILTKLDVGESEAESAMTISTRMSFKMSACMTLSVGNAPVVSMQGGITAGAEMRKELTQYTFAMTQLNVIDKISVDPITRNLIVGRKQLEGSQGQAGASDRNKPLLMMSYEQRGKQTEAKMSCAPIEITWNTLCMQKLLVFVQNRSDAIKSVTITRTAMERMKRYATMENRRMIEHAMSVQLEIDAPKLIVPDNDRTDAGCVIFDAGKLSVIGENSSNGFAMEVGVKAVNVGMPSSMRQRLTEVAAGTDRDHMQFLVKPFDVSMNVQNVDKAEADMTVHVHMGAFAAQLDAGKVARALSVVEVVKGTMKAANDELKPADERQSFDANDLHASVDLTDHTQSLLAKQRKKDMAMQKAVITTDSALFESAIASSLDSESAKHEKTPKKISINPLKCSMIAKVSIDSLSAEIAIANPSKPSKSESAGGHILLIEAKTLEVCATQRAYDMQTTMTLHGVAIEDSWRALSQRCIVWSDIGEYVSMKGTQASSSSSSSSASPQELVQIEMTSVSHKKSPFYNAKRPFATDLKVAFAKLTLSMDEVFLDRLLPLLQLYAEETQRLKKLRANSVLASAPGYASSTSSTTKAGRSRSRGSSIEAVMGMVSMPLIRGLSSSASTMSTPRTPLAIGRGDGPSASATQPAKNPNTPEGILFEAKMRSFNLVLMRPRSEFAVNESNIELEVAYSTEMKELYAQYEDNKRGTMSAECSLQNILMIDRRDKSASYCHKELLECGKFGKKLSRSKTSTKSDLGVPVSPRRQDAEADRDSASPLEQKLFSVHYKDVGGQTEIDVTIANVQSYLTADAIMDLSAIVKKIGATAKSLPAAMKSDEELKTALTRRPISSSQKTSTLSYDVDGEGVIDVDAGKLKPATEEKSLALTVDIVSPHIFMIEEPENPNTRAIVARTEVSLDVRRDTQGDGDSKESVKMSVDGFEVFVLPGLQRTRNSHKIVEPTGFDIHVTRSLEGEDLQACSIRMNLHQIVVRMSLNDSTIFLKTMERMKPESAADKDLKEDKDKVVLVGGKGTVVERWKRYKVKHSPSRTDAGAPDKLGSVDAAAAAAAAQGEKAAHFEVKVEIGRIAFVAVNDYTGQSQPVIRAQVSQSSFSAVGSPQGKGLVGDANLRFTADFFNGHLGVWEPIIEEWNPKLLFRKDKEGGTKLKLTNNAMLQVNVSGAMMREIDRMRKLMGLLVGGRMTKRKDPLVFHNHLGVPIEVYESDGDAVLLSLEDSIPHPLDPQLLARHDDEEEEEKKVFDLNTSNVLFKLCVCESVPLGQQREAILDLPLRTKHPRPYTLKPKNEFLSTKKGMAADPQYEYVIENMRYYPLQVSWDAPWSNLGDPNRLVDISGQPVKSLEAYALTDGWEWIDRQWTVDMSDIVGTNIDKDGFEYAINFATFDTQRRRVFQAFDVARRRRWRRLKGPISSTAQDFVRPLVMYWDVQMDRAGCRTITLRSGLQIRNSFIMPVYIQLSGFTGGGKLKADSRVEYGPIGENETFSVPLLECHAMTIRFRPHGQYAWSAPMDSRVDTETVQTFTKGVECEASGDGRTVYMQGAFQHQEKALIITLMPYIVLHNHLPSDVDFRCFESSTLLGANASPVDSGTLSAGCIVKLAHTQKNSKPSIGLKAGPFAWSGDKYVYPMFLRESVGMSARGLVPADDFTTTMQLLSDDGKSEMILSMTSKIITADVGISICEVHFYSKYILLDRTGLGISVKSEREAISAADKTQDARGSSPTRREGGVLTRSTFGDADRSDLEDKKVSWMIGSNGVVLFQSQDNTVVFGANFGHAWSEEITLVAAGSKVRIEIPDKTVNRVFQLAYSLRALPGRFAVTQELRMMPTYRIVNTTDSDIHVQQYGTRDSSLNTEIIHPKSAQNWHKLDPSAGTTVRFKTEATGWSIATVDLNEIGNSVFSLPRVTSTKNSVGLSRLTERLSTIQVQVNLSKPEEDSFITIVVHEIRPDKNGFCRHTPLSIINDSDVPIVLRQAGMDFDALQRKEDRFVDATTFDRFVLSGEWQPYGWADPAVSSTVKIAIGDVFEDGPNVVTLDLLKTGSHTELSLAACGLGEESGKVMFDVSASAAGKLITATRKTQAELEDEQAIFSDVQGTIQRQVSDELQADKVSNDVGDADNVHFLMSIESICVSLIAERPRRRELFNLLIFGIKQELIMRPRALVTGSAVSYGKVTSTFFRIRDIQIDNYSETAVFPTLMTSRQSSERIEAAKKKEKYEKRGWSTTRSDVLDSTKHDRNAVEELNYFVTLSMLKVVPDGSPVPIYKYTALRLLEFTVSLDSSSVQIYLLDLHKDLIGDSKEEAFATEDPNRWVESFANRALDRASQAVELAPADLARYRPAPVMHFDNITLHPIKIRVSFVQTPFPRAAKTDVFSSVGFYDRVLKVVKAAIDVDDFLIKVNSFIVTDAMESSVSLQNRVKSVYLQEFQSRLVELAGSLFGSMKMLGKPVGLYRNVGAGVKDLFYEPLEGAMHSPNDFVLGVGRGTRSLLTNVATGVISSFGAVIETASKGVTTGATFLAGDSDYARSMAERRRLNAQSTGGVLSGLQAGGESVVTGITSGIFGIVQRPMEEAKKGGAVGLVKGIGLGALGAVVKPVMGVSDGIANVAHGISNQVSDKKFVTYFRPPRALVRSPLDFASCIITPFDASMAAIQDFVLKDKPMTIDDAYVASVVVLRSKDPRTDIVTEVVVAITECNIFNMTIDKSGQIKKNWRLNFDTEVSHCIQNARGRSVEIVRRSDQETMKGKYEIICNSAELTQRVYAILYQLAGKMGSPGKMAAPARQRLSVTDSGRFQGTAVGTGGGAGGGALAKGVSQLSLQNPK